MTVTKNDIVEQVCNRLGFSKNHSTEIVESLLESIKSALVSGEPEYIVYN
jgi:nucleoid DNA-binding protein